MRSAKSRSDLADALTKIVNGHSNSQVDDLLPWAYIRAPEFKGRGLRTAV